MTVATEAAAGRANAEVEAALAVASAHQEQQAQQRAKAVALILAAWATLDTDDMIRSWINDVGQRIYVLLSLAQRILASDAGPFVRVSLDMQNVDLAGLPDVNPGAFAGIASDGRDLESLLAGAVIRTRGRIRRGQTPAEAMQTGALFLRTVANTQLSDAGRAADQVAIVAAEPKSRRGRPQTIGWVRMLQPPSCGRCAILAGRFYKWSDGFLRHPNCDCRHIPVTENVAGDLTTDPKLYFNSLTPQEQNDLFGKANAEAIFAGADMSRVINATGRKNGMFVASDGRRYTYERTGRYKDADKQVLRPTPWQIMHDAKGDIAEARRLLRRFGYILS
jgi:hypothetical protein